MISTGRLCIKTAGREAGKKCVVVSVIDKNIVLIDGEVRRKKCSITHLEPLKQTIKIKDNEQHSTVVSEFKKLGIALKETKPKNKKPKPTKIRAEQRKKLANAKPAIKPTKSIKDSTSKKYSQKEIKTTDLEKEVSSE